VETLRPSKVLRATWYSDVRDALYRARDAGIEWVLLGSVEGTDAVTGESKSISNYGTLSNTDPDVWYQVSVYRYGKARLATCICPAYRYIESGLKAAEYTDEDGRSFSTVMQGMRAFLANHPDISEVVKLTSKDAEKGDKEAGTKSTGTIILARRDALKNRGYTKAQLEARKAAAEANGDGTEGAEGSAEGSEVAEGDAAWDAAAGTVDIP
jgi:hypothetical protein